MDVDRVACRPRHVRDHHTLFAEQLVDQGTLADVGSTDQCDSNQVRFGGFLGDGQGLLFRSEVPVEGLLGIVGDLIGVEAPDPVGLVVGLFERCVRERFDEGFQEIEGPATVFSRDRIDKLETQGIEFAHAIHVFGNIDFVDGQGQRLFGASQGARDNLVLGEQTRLGIGDKDDGIGLRDRDARLGLYLGFQSALGIRVEPGRIDEKNPPAGDDDFFGDPVSGNPGHVLDQRPAVAGVAIEQPRLADIGAAHDGHDWEYCFRIHWISRA